MMSKLNYKKGDSKVLNAWAFYDWANSVYPLVISSSVFPIYYGFKGGKGVATYLGGLIGLSFFVGLTFSIIWLIVAKVMKVSSIAALTATVLSPIYFYFITTHDVRATMVIFLINLFIYFTHRENIRRIMNGEEGVIGS